MNEVTVESRKDNEAAPVLSGEEAELERREYSSPACYLHEFEQQDGAKTKPPADPHEPQKR